ncbi:MAG: glycosyl transferase [Acetobacteraceae bacterium]|nr:glycosyl transferase [Acetobacteraceae bacterium]
MTKVLVVSGADAGYFPLMQEMFASMAPCIPPAESGLEIYFGAIDAGLTEAQCQSLVEAGVVVRGLPENAGLPAKHLNRRPALAVNFGKLWLDQIFPEFDVMIWIDADAWMQRPGTIEHFVAATSEGALAICAECNRFMSGLVRVRWLLGGLWGIGQLRSINLNNGRHAGLPLSILRKIGLKATLNAGIFALNRVSPAWNAMRAWQKQVLRRGKPFSSDQLSISLAVHIDGIKLELLPDSFNYIGPWMLDADSGMLVERYYPYEPVRIVHMASEKVLRFDPDARIDVPYRSGAMAKISVRQSFMQGSSARADR